MYDSEKNKLIVIDFGLLEKALDIIETKFEDYNKIIKSVNI